MTGGGIVTLRPEINLDEIEEIENARLAEDWMLDDLDVVAICKKRAIRLLAA